MLYSKTTGGFYDQEIHGSNIPADSVEITQEQYVILMNGQSKGKIVTADSNGYPVLKNPTQPSSNEISAAVTAARSAAYIVESDPLFFKSQRGEATVQQWLDKVEEIKKRYPEGIMPSFPKV